MLLVMDVGNSHTVIGLFEGDSLRARWRLVTGVRRTADELRLLLVNMLRDEEVDRTAIEACCIASVVPDLNYALNHVCERLFGFEALFVGPGIRTGITIQVDNPKEVGADRIANAVAARARFEGPLIVVDFGTATTFDALTAAGEYRGGCIAPGIEIATDALFQRCAKLPRVDLARPERVIGRDTVSHIQAGLSYGYADLVDGLIGRIAAEMGGAPKVIATGGWAEYIAGIAARIDHVEPQLTLDGLLLIHQKNARTTR
jgi:type III pantothenate kinase